MKYFMQNAKYACWGHFPCFYRQGNVCEFFKQAKLMLEKCPGNTQKPTDYSMNISDTFSLPCLEFTEEELQRGIPNLF